MGTFSKYVAILYYLICYKNTELLSDINNSKRVTVASPLKIVEVL